METKGLFPAELFFQLLVGEVNRSMRRGYAFALVAIGVDFGSTTEATGRAEAASAVETHVCTHLRHFDWATRIGDTFLIMLPETDASHLSLIEDRIRSGANEQLAGRATARTASKTYVFEASWSKPDATALQADVDALIAGTRP